MLLHNARSGVESTYLARSLRRPEPPRIEAPRLCTYCDAPGAPDHLTCGSAECRARYDRFTLAMVKILEEIP